MFRTVLAGILAATLLPAAANAVTLDYAADYGNSVFSYGYGSGGSFTAFPNSYSGGCYGVVTFACETNGSNSSEPFVGAATDGAAFSFLTVDVPANTLILHPGAPAGQNAIVMFTAPISTTYTFSGIFLRLDEVDGGGDGVTLEAYFNGGLVATGSLPDGPQFSSAGFNGSAFFNAGDTLALNIGFNGEYTFDSTGYQGTVSYTAVPEPASWAMMIGGFGMVGGAMRSRRRSVAIA